jgi:methionyl-tRNA formyltransferase
LSTELRRTVLFGKGSLAIRVGEWFVESPRHDLVAVVPVVPEPEWTDSFADWARRRGVRLASSGDWRDLGSSRSRLADLGFSVFYDRILPADLIERFDRVLNLHNGPLPRYRGVGPINWALKNGERTHGVTIHEVTPGIDDGPVVAQLTYSIYPEFDEVVDVYRRALEYGWVLFCQTMPILDLIAARPQDERAATYYGAGDLPRLGERRGFTRELTRSPPEPTR